MKTFQIRLNHQNPWDGPILAFLGSIPPYYRSRAVKEALLTYLGLPCPPGPPIAAYGRAQLHEPEAPDADSESRNGPGW
ncbi:MAG: hypothetical protein KKA73_01560 [Chloroflexi bacterium]|nr:hypothetical protein [Chloroflexota bacterium]MBU1746351.1 hypothetical protein [Chloroflexota bacterium]